MAGAYDSFGAGGLHTDRSVDPARCGRSRIPSTAIEREQSLESPGGAVTNRLLSVVGLVVAAMALIAVVSASSAPTTRKAHAGTNGSCRAPTSDGQYVRRVTGALRSRRDVWGDALLAAPRGPTYNGASRFLKPLLLARAARGRKLTDSGVHYVPFTQPFGARGAISVALHVADGSQIVSDRAHGRALTIAVGHRGKERYGSCLRRLAQPGLAEGYLPILDTRYVDSSGVTYRQESFAARVPETDSLVSFVRLSADATGSKDGVTRLRFTPSVEGLSSDGSRLQRRGHTYLVFSSGGSFNGKSLKYTVPRGTALTVYIAWLVTPSSSRGLTLDQDTYDAARQSVSDYWERRLAHGGMIIVPEKRVLDAERSLLIQELGLTWRYSIGNQYEQFSSPEGVDVARVMAEYGHSEVSRAILGTSLRKKPSSVRRRPTRNPSWKIGARLVGVAQQYRLSGDQAFVLRATPVLRRYVRSLGGQLRSNRHGLLRRERYSSDVPDPVYGLHSQAVVWQGLRSMGQVWAETGNRPLATKSLRLAGRLGAALRRAIRASQRRLPDGTLFIPVRLFDDERPYRSLTASREGSYWNLVAPYAFASGLIRPRSSQATGVLEYMLRHGSRLLGLVRAGAYALYGEPAYPTSGSDQVYGLNVARFLADNDQPGQLVLSLYGQLAAAMAPGTFVSGESASIAPLSGSGSHYRSMYLPPNGASNAAFLETLRSMLVHETTSRSGAPRGLELAYAMPREWLRAGQEIEVRGIPTSFGRVSFTIESGADSAFVSLRVPDRSPLRTLRFRLRLPTGERISGVSLDGSAFRRFDPASGTIDLPPRAGSMELEIDMQRT
jgi:hypothetical protein